MGEPKQAPTLLETDERRSVRTQQSAALRIPVSTYRLQFNRSFTFEHAREIVSYLHDLGITDLYCSSYLKAVPGSLHGYDVVDPTQLNPEVGTDAEFRKLVETLRAHRMGQVLDVVPNHMGIGRSANPWWLDVLEHGPGSRYATFFDIDWSPLKPELEDKVLLPILGDLYGTVLENREITLVYEGGLFHVRYGDHRLPISIKSAILILQHRLDVLVEQSGAGDPQYLQEMLSIMTAMSHLPPGGERNAVRVAERYREKGIIKRRLEAVVRENPAVQAFLEENVRLFNGTRGDSRSFDLLDRLLTEQAYWLSYWRVASEEINYRRFFDINELAAIRMEDPAVFRAFHERIFELVQNGEVTGLRIDHVDGLYDPGDYLRRLHEWARTALAAESADTQSPLFLVVEKILGKGEPLPESWIVHGTTGYEFLNLVNGLFVDGSKAKALDDAYHRFTGERQSFDDLVYAKKQLIMLASMSSEINVLGYQLNRLSERDRRSRDFTLNSLTHAIREIIACFPVYRTYVTDAADGVMERDREYIQRAVARAKRRNPALSGLVFDFVRDLLLNRGDDRDRQDHAERLAFVMKFQQTTSPVTAKGIEDTAFYIYNRLVSLNEVGADPGEVGVSVDTFHKRMRERRAHWPCSLSATSTHDTKRSEDVRARINILSEIPQEWKIRAMRWSRLNRKYKSEVDAQPVPDRNDEYLLYQTLLGTWPLNAMDATAYRTYRDRIQEYMAKAMKEAKVHTSWMNPNKAYEEAVHHFVEAILDREHPNPFLEDLLPFQESIAQWGMWNSLAQLMIKLAAPGIPDFYQGTELWDFSLVDPDNRRPVDYRKRRELLTELRQRCSTSSDRIRLVQELMKTATDGRIKLYVTMMGLQHRRTNPAMFHEGEYVPLETGGQRGTHVCAFTRIYRDQAVVAVVPRLVGGLASQIRTPPVGLGVWSDTWVTAPSWTPETRYRNLMTEEIIPVRSEEGRQTMEVAAILNELPVALLERQA